MLGRHYFQGSDLTAALVHLEKARALKPLDQSLRELEWMIRVGQARNYALVGRWDEGRAEFDAADKLLPESRRMYSYLARKAIFEYKAGQGERSDEYVREAQALLAEPGPLWLSLAIESSRYHMPKSTVNGYAKNWETEQKKKCRSETAGALAELLGGFVAAGVDYPGRAKHMTQVVAYLRRTLRLKYRREDIENVLAFLKYVPDEFTLFEKLIRAGLKQHPDSVLLNLDAGEVELTKGKHLVGGARTAQHYLETALKLAEASTDPKVTALLPVIRSQLGVLGEITERFGRFGFPFGGDPFGTSFIDTSDFEDDFDDEDDELDDFDDEDRVPVPAPPRRAPKKRGSRKRKKKR